jgi:aminopeptidase
MRLSRRHDEAELAAKVVKECLRVGDRDLVTIQTGKHTIELAEEMALECFAVGADVLLNLYTDRYYVGYLTLLPVESLREASKFCRALTETSTVEIFMTPITDPGLFERIPAEKLAANQEGESKGHQTGAARRLRTATLGIGLVTRERAKAYGIDYKTWRSTIIASSTVDHRQLRRVGRSVAQRLERAKQARVTTGAGTDLKFSLRGRRAYVDDGIIDDEDLSNGLCDVSIPAGSAAVAPDEMSAEGRVVFDIPLLYRGKVINGLSWEFRSGRLSSMAAGTNEEVLLYQYRRAQGDRDRLGSVTLGLNPRAKLGYIVNSITRGAITLAIGSNKALGGSNSTIFSLSSTLSGATLELDGEPIVEQGRLLA